MIHVSAMWLSQQGVIKAQLILIICFYWCGFNFKTEIIYRSNLGHLRIKMASVQKCSETVQIMWGTCV